MPSRASFTILWFCFATSGIVAGADDPVVIRNLNKPGRIEVENTGPDIALRGQLEVQKKREGVWSAVASDVRLLDKCEAGPKSKCQVLKRGEKIVPMAYDGFTCNMKCPGGCKGNAYLGPGEFRIVITNCDGTRKFTGPSFRLD